MKKILFALVGILIWGIANATSTPQGVSETTLITTNTTPVTVAIPSGATYFIDFGDRTINPSSSADTILVTSGGTTVINSYIAPTSGWEELQGWPYPAMTLNNSIVVTDVGGSGLHITFKFWNAQSRTNRPQ